MLTGLITVKQSGLWQCNVDSIDDYCKKCILSEKENFSSELLFGPAEFSSSGSARHYPDTKPFPAPFILVPFRAIPALGSS